MKVLFLTVKVGGGSDVSTQVGALLSSLPHLSAHAFVQIQENIEQLQSAVLEEWIGELVVSMHKTCHKRLERTGNLWSIITG